MNLEEHYESRQMCSVVFSKSMDETMKNPVNTMYKYYVLGRGHGDEATSAHGREGRQK